MRTQPDQGSSLAQAAPPMPLLFVDEKTSQPMQREAIQFQIICKICDGLGITFECPENAPSSTPIKCRHCGAPRGTLGQLREMSISGRQDLFEA